MVKLSDIFFIPSISISLFLEIAIFLLLSYTFFFTILIIKNYKQADSSEMHYILEKRSYLLVTTISLAIILKLLLLPFFFSTLNSLSDLIPGAMCSAGVVGANSFGIYTVIIKILIIFLSLLWLKLNAQDEITPQQPYFRSKLYLFIVLYFFIIIELLLEIGFFTHLTTDSPVLCCSTIYKTVKSTNFLLSLPLSYLLSLYIIIYLLLLFFNYKTKRYLSAFFAVVFSYTSYYTLVYFFGTYIYELPTHKCPYCMLQADYYFIGYFIYFTLFMGLYYSASSLFFNFSKNDYIKSSLFFTLFVLLSSSSFILYILMNKTLL